MKILKRYTQTLLVIFFLFSVGSQRAIAIPPPDFIFTAGTQMLQFFSLIAIFLSSIYLGVLQFIKLFVDRIKLNWKITIIGLILIIVASMAFTFIFSQIKHKKASTNTEEVESHLINYRS